MTEHHSLTNSRAMDTSTKPKKFKYQDKRSNEIYNEFWAAYVVQTIIMIQRVMNERCVRCYGMNFEERHTEDLSWNEKVDRFGRMAFLRVRDEDILTEWMIRLEKQVTPPAHPTEYPELMSATFRWTEVIDDHFIEQILTEAKKHEELTAIYLSYYKPNHID